MRRTGAVLLFVLAVSHLPAAAPIDVIAAARKAYNAGDYEAAIAAAREAASDPKSAAEARIVLGRALVERFRRSAESHDLGEARAALLEAGSVPLTPALRTEWLIGCAQMLFFEDQFGAAAAMFALLLDDPRAEAAIPGGRERLIDWWATAADRAAQSHDPKSRRDEYSRLAARLQLELHRDASLGAAAYWRVVAMHGAGDLDEAWSEALAAWVRAPLAPDRGAQIRADLERFVSQALIPERARRSGRDQDRQTAALRAEWEEFKKRWSIGNR